MSQAVRFSLRRLVTFWSITLAIGLIVTTAASAIGPVIG